MEKEKIKQKIQKIDKHIVKLEVLLKQHRERQMQRPPSKRDDYVRPLHKGLDVLFPWAETENATVSDIKYIVSSLKKDKEFWKRNLRKVV